MTAEKEYEMETVGQNTLATEDVLLTESYLPVKDLEAGAVQNLDERDNIEIKPGEEIIVLKNVHKTYLLGVEGVPALRGVDLTVRSGEFVIIFGTSGGGKTTLLSSIGTIDRPTKGSVSICGHTINTHTKDSVLANIRLRKIGFVFQTFNLISSMTALENVELPMILDGRLSPTARRNRATRLLRSVGLGKRLTHLPSMMSGGEQQRCTIARAVSNSPSILLLDEPTGDLDSMNSQIVMSLLLELQQSEGITLVMVTHDLNLRHLADRVVTIRDGKVAGDEEVPLQLRDTAREELKNDYEAIQANMSRAEVLEGDENQESQQPPHELKYTTLRRIETLPFAAACIPVHCERETRDDRSVALGIETSPEEPALSPSDLSQSSQTREKRERAELLLKDKQHRRRASSPARVRPSQNRRPIQSPLLSSRYPQNSGRRSQLQEPRPSQGSRGTPELFDGRNYRDGWQDTPPAYESRASAPPKPWK